MADEPKDKEPEELDKDKILESDLFKDAVADAVKKATESLEGNRDTILSEKRAIADKLKASEEAAKKFEGLDVSKIRTMIDAAEKSEEAQMITEGRIDEVIAARTASVKSGYENQFAEKDTQIDSLTQANQQLQSMYESKLIGDAIQSEAIAQGMLPEAIKDAVRSADGIFTLGDDGSVQAAKADEFINSPERFIKSLKDSNPYYWPPNADFRMNGSGGGDAKDINERMVAAAESSDFEAYKKLRDAQRAS